MASAKSNLTRVLHLTLLLIVLHQLIGSAFVERPMPGDDADWPFLVHVWTGTAGLQILFGFWLWILARNRCETRVSALVPWIFPSRLKALFGEADQIVSDLLALRRPSLERPAISSAVHGLGLLLATLLASSGALWYFVLDGTYAGKLVLLVHKAAGNLMWAYIVGHATMALLHHFFGEDTLVKMFWLGHRSSRNAEPVRAK